MIIFQSTWLQLDIISCSYQSYLLKTLILLCLASPFLEPQAVFVWYLSYTINSVELMEYDALISLDPNKALVIDDISFRIIQSCTEVLCRLFHHLFTISLRYGLIPTGWNSQFPKHH